MKKDKNIKWIILILLVTIILLFPLFHNKRLYGHDTLFHTGNIIYLSKTISINNILGDNIIKLKTYPFGYGTWLFYPKLPHLLGAYIYLISKNIYTSMNIIYFITTFLSGIIIFYLSKKIFNNKKVAFLSSLIYLTYSYHICEIYIRDAFAENYMFFVIPLIFLGLYELKDNNTKKFYLYFITGYVIGIYSHLISMLFCTIFVSLFLIYYRKIFLKKDKIKKLLLSTIIVTLISLPFLTTIIEHRLLGNYIVFSETFSNKFVATGNVIEIDKYLNHHKDAIYNNIIIYINYITTILIIITTITFFLKNNKTKYQEERKLLFFSILIYIAFINSKWLWNNLPGFFSTIQFPWRITTFLSLSISLYAPLCFIKKHKDITKLIVNTLYIIAILTIILDGKNNIFYYGKEQYSKKEILSSPVVMGWQNEYLPIKAYEYKEKILLNNYGLIIKENTNNNYQIISNKNIKIKILKDTNTSLKFKINNLKESTIIILPRTYYLGYKLTDNNGKKYILKESTNGYLETKINKNSTYILKYTGTIYDKISRIISLITIITIGVIYIWKRKK